jgi:hypothetical protein
MKAFNKLAKQLEFMVFAIIMLSFTALVTCTAG